MVSFRCSVLENPILVPKKRLKYCNHGPCLYVTPEDPILEGEAFWEHYMQLGKSPELELSSPIERFYAEQPILSHLLDVVPLDGVEPQNESEALRLRMLAVSAHMTFNEHFPAPAVLVEHLQEVAGLMLRPFGDSEVCLCSRYQGPLMRFAIGKIEAMIDEGALTPVHGNLVAMLLIVIIEALDQAATLAQWTRVEAGRRNGLSDN